MLTTEEILLTFADILTTEGFHLVICLITVSSPLMLIESLVCIWQYHLLSIEFIISYSVPLLIPKIILIRKGDYDLIGKKGLAITG